MKRQLSLVLALVMILGSFSSVFAAVSVDQSAVNVAGAFLKAEGVLEGDDGNLMLNANLKRRDAVVLLSRLYDVEAEAKAFPSDDLTFEDLTDDHYNGYIAWSVDKGYFEGHNANTFGFNEEMTAQDFATVVLRVLGYTVDEAAYPKALELAEELGLLIDIEGVENKTVVTRGMMALMTLNAMYVEVKGEKVTLAEKLGIKNLPVREEEKATDLKVEKVYTENLAEIRVKLSNVDLVKTEDALYNPTNYRLTNTNAKVRHVHLEEDELVLTLVPYGKVLEQPKFEVLEKGKAFKLTIRNVDPKINETSGWVTPVDNTIPVVENVEFMGTYGIKVTTSEPIENPEERNFRIDSRTSMFVEQYGRDIILTPYHGKAFDKDAVTLTTDILEDFAGYKTVKEDHAMELSDDEGLPVVKRAYRSGSKVVVEFDRDVYEKSVGAYENRKDFGNISFVERRAPFYAKDAVKVDINVVEYTFEREVPKGIVVEMVGVANHFNKAMERAEVEVEEFKDEFAPAIIDYTENVAITKAEQTTIDGLTTAQKDQLWLDGKVVATDVMELEFDKDMAELKDLTVAQLNARLGEYFTLYERDITTTGMKAASGVTFQVVKKDSDWLQLEFNNIMLNNKNKDFDYVLEVRNFSDSNRIRMDIEYLDFQVVQRKAAFRVIPKIEINSNSYFNRKGSEIILKFNRPVNKEEAANAKNYYLDSKLHVAEAIVERDGKTVALIVYDKTPAQLKAGYSVLEISPRVVDLSVPAQSVAERFWDLKTGEFIPGVEGSKSKVTAVTTTSIEVDNKVITVEAGTPLAKALAAMGVNVSELKGAKVELSKDNTTLTEVELEEKTYSANFFDALVQELDGVTIVGKGITKTIVNGDVIVNAKDVTIEKIQIDGDLEIDLPYASVKFTSKDNHITGAVTVTKGDASFNTRIDGNVTVAAGAKATFKNVELAAGKTVTVTVNGTATFEDVEFAATTNLVVAGEATLKGETGKLNGANISGAGKVNIEDSSSEDKIAQDKKDKEAVEKVEKTIDLSTEANVKAARKAYNELTSAQKDLVDADWLKGLIDAEKGLVNETAAKAVKKLIDELPKADELKLEDRAKVEAARAAYNKLNKDQKDLLAGENGLDTLEAAETKLVELADKKAVGEVETAIKAIVKAEGAKYADKAAVEAAIANVGKKGTEVKVEVEGEEEEVTSFTITITKGNAEEVIKDIAVVTE